MSDKDCLFCKIIAGEIPSEKVYEDDATYAFKDINPKAKVHVLIVPRKHYANVAELAKEEGFEPGEPVSDGEEAFRQYLQASAAIEELKGRLEKARREADELAVWGDFSPEAVKKLAEDGVVLRFFSVYDSEFAAVRRAAGDACGLSALLRRRLPCGRGQR